MESEATSLVTVANCADIHEATSIQVALDSAGISAFIPDEVTAAIAPHHFATSSGVRVQVADNRAEEARQVIAEMRKN
jgi:hypothetical protein